MEDIHILNKTKINIKTFLIKIGAVFIAIVTIEFTMLQIMQYFIGNKFFYDKLSISLKFVLFFLIALLILFLYSTIYIYSKYNSLISELDDSNTVINDSLVLILENAYNNQRWSEVVKIGKQLSEPLWYTGKFNIRVKIGELVESAAALCNEYDIQSETLLDDIGWTNFRLGKKNEAIKNIRRGLQIAKDHSNYYLMAKGNRHFADIHLSNREFDECKKSYDIAMSYLSSIEDDVKQIEMDGNLQYTLSKYYLEMREYENALSSVNLSQSFYQEINDYDREVKLYNLKGKILLLLHREDEAIDAYQKGLKLATEISNNVHMASNSAALAECYLEDGKIELAKKMIEIAHQNSTSMNDPILIKKIHDLYIVITSQKR